MKSLFDPCMLAVFRKELRDTLRDKRSMMMFMVFVLMYPLMMMGIMNFIIKKSTAGEKEEITVIVSGAEYAGRLVNDLRAAEITVQEENLTADAEIETRLKKKDLTAVIVVPEIYPEQYNELKPATLMLWFNSTSDQRSKLNKVNSILRQYEAVTAQSRLLQRGVAPALINPIDIQEFDTATAATRSSQLAGTILGFMFVFAFYFCLNITLDSTAGERERKSLEILLVQPATATQIVIGKWLAAALFSAVGLTLELAAANAILGKLPLEEIGMSWQLGWDGLALVLLLSMPLCLFAAAFEIAFALNSKSFKEAQTNMGFIMFIPMLPVLVVAITGAESAPWMYSLPVLGEQEVLKALAKGELLQWWQYLAPAVTSTVLSIACLLFASKRMASERFVLGI